MYHLYRPLFFKKGKRIESFNPLDIVFVEAQADFVKALIGNDKHFFSHPIRIMEQKLYQDFFVRVHRSYIINLRHIKYIEDGLINLGTVEIPLQKSYSAAFFEQLWKMER